jgi:hypothetical protein
MVACPKCDSKNLEQLFSTCSFRTGTAKFEMKRGPAHNPFENLTLQHVRDDHGKPVKVNSERELRAAEKKYGFVHHASHSLTQDGLDTPPQHESWAGDVRHDYKWKWTPPDQRNDMTGVEVGAVSRDKLLVA